MDIQLFNGIYTIDFCVKFWQHRIRLDTKFIVKLLSWMSLITIIAGANYVSLIYCHTSDMHSATIRYHGSLSCFVKIPKIAFCHYIIPSLSCSNNSFPRSKHANSYSYLSTNRLKYLIPSLSATVAAW